MFIRTMVYGAMAVGALVLGTGCMGTAEAQQEETAVRQQDASTFCGGIAGIPCAEGFVCVDDPNDDCNPKTGGADCGGICVQATPTSRCNQPERDYISRDPNRCAVIRFTCPEGQVPFSDDCGCGCEPAP